MATIKAEESDTESNDSMPDIPSTTALLEQVKIENESDSSVDLSKFPETPQKKKSPKKRSPKKKDPPKRPFEGLPKRSLSHPYFNDGESGSDSDSDSEPDGMTGKGAPAYPYEKSGFTITIKHVDTFSQIPVRRYKAYISIFECRAVMSCIRFGYEAYTIFKLLQRNRHMKKNLKVMEPIEIDILHGVIDDNGFPLLKWLEVCFLPGRK
ncbi:hypothetical protein BKA64DRAFT_634355 [Cadophora sp. MPI-SDFR-AT-0126]|nr:hypothetical protein BKA64DRAFT_634355 [Leotiomycetes sp. MPI-SDFR-AT-0126]